MRVNPRNGINQYSLFEFKSVDSNTDNMEPWFMTREFVCPEVQRSELNDRGRDPKYFLVSQGTAIPGETSPYRTRPLSRARTHRLVSLLF